MINETRTDRSPSPSTSPQSVVAPACAPAAPGETVGTLIPWPPGGRRRSGRRRPRLVRHLPIPPGDGDDGDGGDGDGGDGDGGGDDGNGGGGVAA